MDFTTFREKLIPFFTPEQIGNLDTCAINDAIDAHGKPGDLDSMRDLHFMGREFICNLLYDVADDITEIKRMFGINMDPIKHAAMLNQMDNEW